MASACEAILSHMDMMIARSFFSRDMAVVVWAGGCAGAECTQSWPDAACPQCPLIYTKSGALAGYDHWLVEGRGLVGWGLLSDTVTSNGNQGLVGLRGSRAIAPAHSPWSKGGGVLVTVLH